MSEQDEPRAGAPTPPFRSYSVPVLWFLAGLAIFGAVSVGALLLVSSLPVGGPAWLLVVAAIVLLAVTAGAAIFAMRRGKVPLGSGLLVGYAVATAFSSGQCTLWSANPDYAMLTGFFVYLMGLGAVFIVAVVAVVVDAVRRNRRAS